MVQPKRLIRIACVASLMFGCRGQLGVPNTDSPATDGPPGGGVPESPAAVGTTPEGGAASPPAPSGPQGLPATGPLGLRPLQRLNRSQLDATLQDLLGLESTQVPSLPADVFVSGFTVGAPVGELHAQALFNVMEAAARAAIARPGFLPCDPATVGEAVCAETFIGRFLPRAFRRPASEEIRADYFTTYETVSTRYDFETAIENIVHRALLSPEFLYHVEGDAQADGRADGYALASRLSYLLWNSLPSVALTDAVVKGDLSDAAGIAVQSQHLLSDERAQRGIRAFYREWLRFDAFSEIKKQPDVFPNWNEQLRKDYEQSLERQLNASFFEVDDGVEELLRADTIFATGRMRAFLGLAEGGNAEFERVPVDTAKRSGLLTHPALMGLLARDDRSHPIRRGVWVWEHLLCAPLPDPPDDVEIAEFELTPGRSQRQAVEEATSPTGCTGCHSLINPVGFLFESFDAAGRTRTEDDNGQPVDTAVTIAASGTLAELAGPTADAVEFGARLLEQRRQIQSCLARQMLSYTHRRPVDAPDTPSLEQVIEALSAGPLTEGLTALVQTDSFARR